MPLEPHPDSYFHGPAGRAVELKVHRCLWSGAYPENSRGAIEECARERVLRVEIDVQSLRGGEFIVFHDDRFDRLTDATGPVGDATALAATRARYRDGSHPLLFSEAVALLAAHAFPRRIELDLKELVPYSWAQAEALARAAQPAKERLSFAGVADWNLRRLLAVDPSLGVSLNPHAHLDSEGAQDGRLPRGAYGYFDAHPLARQRSSSVGDYLRERFGGILRLVPGIAEAHLRLATLERMLDDGVADAAEIFHGAGVALDVWTLDAGTPAWRERFARAVAAGVDIVTTNTPRALAEAGRAL